MKNFLARLRRPRHDVYRRDPLSIPHGLATLRAMGYTRPMHEVFIGQALHLHAEGEHERAAHLATTYIDRQDWPRILQGAEQGGWS